MKLIFIFNYLKIRRSILFIGFLISLRSIALFGQTIEVNEANGVVKDKSLKGFVVCLELDVKTVEKSWARYLKSLGKFETVDNQAMAAMSIMLPTVASDAVDYGNDFAAFKRALIAQPIGWKDGVLTFATIIHEGPLKPGKVNGKPVNLRPSRVNDSPFIRSDADSGIVYLRKGEATLKLDFSDPRNPAKTVGVPLTREFR